MNYFKYFPTVFYKAPDGTSLQITNIAERAQIRERIHQNITVFYDYVIQDGQRPDTVATALYGSPIYTWVILLLNNIFTLFDWPLTSHEFNAYIIDKYGSVTNAQIQQIFTTMDGYVIDSTTYQNLPPSGRGAVTNAFDDEFDKNETKRRIKVVPADFVVSLAQELKRVL